MNWVALSITGLFSFSFMSFIITLLSRRGYPVTFILIGIAAVLLVVYCIQAFLIEKYTFVFSPFVVMLLLAAGILSAIGNYAMYQAANNAPNAGLAIGIAGMQAVVVAILAVLFLRDKITNIQILGIILSIIAIFLMSFGNTKTTTKASSPHTKITVSKK